MQFYAAYYLVGSGIPITSKYRENPEDSFQDLKNMGYEIVGLRGGKDNSFPLYDPNRNIGIALVII